jgi:hypothetical protein
MALVSISFSASGQIRDRFGRAIDPSSSAIVDKNGNPIDGANPFPIAEKQELATLATANTAVPAPPLYGGTYILNQFCTGYGSVALRYRAADGATMVTLLTKVVADASGTVVQFGSGQLVDVVLTGTTGCNVTLSRIP